MEEASEFTLGFGTIRNNTALKLCVFLYVFGRRFGTIRNNTALKPVEVAVQFIQVLEPFETTQL